MIHLITMTRLLNLKSLLMDDQNHVKKIVMTIFFVVMLWVGKFILAALIIAPVAYVSGKIVKRLKEREGITSC